MNTLDAIAQRRSIKKFDPDHKFTDQEFQTFMDHVILSPTSFNIQNWRFVLVEDDALRAQIRGAAWDQVQVTDSSLLFALCADVKAWEKEPQRYWKNAAQETQDILVPMIGQFYEGREELQRDEGIRSIGIAAQTMMLAAKAMGYDSCPMIGFDPDAVSELIKLPENHIVGMLLAIGKAAAPANPRGGQLPLEDVLIRNTF